MSGCPFVPSELLPDTRVVAHAAIIAITDRLATQRLNLQERADALAHLRLAHHVWIRATAIDDYDPGAWESFFHHPEFPTWEEVRELLVVMGEEDHAKWGTGLDLVTSLQRITAALPTRCAG